MGRVRAAVGSAVFFVLAPGVVAGVVPWWLTGWRARALPAWWLPLRVAGVVLLVAALTSAAQMTSESGSTATWAL